MKGILVHSIRCVVEKFLKILSIMAVESWHKSNYTTLTGMAIDS